MYQANIPTRANLWNGAGPMTEVTGPDLSSTVEQKPTPGLAVLKLIAMATVAATVATVGAALRRTMVERPRQRRQRKQRYAELAGFDNRMLKDIGLARGDLRYVEVRGIDPRQRRKTGFRSQNV